MKQLVTFISLILLSFSAYSLEIGDITMPDTMQAGDQSLMLNGAGIRSKFIFDLYVAGLYLNTKSADAEQVIKADENMTLRLHIISSKITSEKMTNATREGFDKSTDNNTQAIASQIDQFLEAFSDEIVDGDVFEFNYQPNQGTIVSKNGVFKSTVSSLAFKSALFGIWLSDKPVKEKLKSQLLGQ